MTSAAIFACGVLGIAAAAPTTTTTTKILVNTIVNGTNEAGALLDNLGETSGLASLTVCLRFGPKWNSFVTFDLS